MARRVVEVDHPLVRDRLARLREHETKPRTFRRLVRDLTLLVAAEAARELQTERVEVQTPLERTPQEQILGSSVAVVAVLRAGLGMLDAALELLPDAPVGFVGIFRDEEQLRPVPYFLNLPDSMRGRDALVLDPMVATGGSAAHAVQVCREAGARRVMLICLLAAPEGLAAIAEEHPDVAVYTAAVDRGLNDVGYIVPGLGDAGDRLYGTF